MQLETPHYQVKELFEDLYMWMKSWGDSYQDCTPGRGRDFMDEMVIWEDNQRWSQTRGAQTRFCAAEKGSRAVQQENSFPKWKKTRQLLQLQLALLEDDYYLGFSFSCCTIWHTVPYASI